MTPESHSSALLVGFDERGRMGRDCILLDLGIYRIRYAGNM